MEILQYTALELGRRIQNREIGVKEALTAVLDRIEERESSLHAYIHLDPERAMRQAEQVQERILKGELRHPLAGVPVAIKDNLCTQEMPTTCASRILSDFRSPFTAQAVRNLEQAGAVILGKTNMDEFAMGSTTETSAYGPTQNPVKEGYVPGGSSGGSCAAVAAEECFYALGTDTGGSIRQPSSFCGVTGLKLSLIHI